MRDHLGDMIEERLDLATIEGEVTDSSLVSRRIGALTHLLVAAPTYLERSGPRAQRASSAAGRQPIRTIWRTTSVLSIIAGKGGRCGTSRDRTAR